jgi:hypothetical protein
MSKARIGPAVDDDDEPQFFHRHVESSWYSLLGALVFGPTLFICGFLMVYIFTFMEIEEGQSGFQFVTQSAGYVGFVIVILVALVFVLVGYLVAKHLVLVIWQSVGVRMGRWPYGLYVSADAILLAELTAKKSKRYAFIPKSAIDRIDTKQKTIKRETGSTTTTSAYIRYRGRHGAKEQKVYLPRAYWGEPQRLVDDLKSWL